MEIVRKFEFMFEIPEKIWQNSCLVLNIGLNNFKNNLKLSYQFLVVVDETVFFLCVQARKKVLPLCPVP